jgi:hydrogenase-1 operon protein HyaF
MRVGYWSTPDSDDIEMTVMPVGHDGGEGLRRGRTGAGTIAALATKSGDELLRQCPGLAEMLSRLIAALSAQRADAPTDVITLAHLSEAERTLLMDILGEGEVSGIVAMPDRRVVQIQESVFAGLWRIRIEGDDARPTLDYLEIGAVPEIVSRAAQDLTVPEIALTSAPDGAMNVMPVLAEIRERMAKHREGHASHVINFTLLPMSGVDVTHLSTTLGNGPIQLFSRGYGSCRVLATGARNVWSVQFLNTMDTPILDTLEIGDVPISVLAAREDFEDSAERLGEILQAFN